MLSDIGSDAVFYCGGTELLLVAKLGFTEFTDLIDVKGIDELSTLSANGELRIGAAVTHRQIERSRLVRQRWPSLALMERDVGNLRVRNVGSLGGNLCFSDPHSDPATYLIAADARLTLQRADAASRQLAVSDFLVGPYQTALLPGELLVAVHVPAPMPGSVLVHRKMAFAERPAITVAVNLRVAHGAIADARIAVGSVGLRAVRAAAAETLVAGLAADRVSDDTVAAAVAAAADAACPVEDANGSVEYKRQLVRVLTTRCLIEAVDRAQAA
jgi:aerobic carbon-monoxide dehydrogenase medium subunit